MSRSSNLSRLPLRTVRALVLDVDGVLTDGGMYYGPQGDCLRRFNVKDGLGIRRIQELGIRIAWITGEKNEMVRRRAVRLGVKELHQGVLEKLPVLDKFLRRLRIRPEHAVYMGDDLTDLPPMKRVGIPVAVADAVAPVRRAARWVTRLKGGEGAVREVCDALAASRNRSS